MTSTSHAESAACRHHSTGMARKRAQGLACVGGMNCVRAGWAEGGEGASAHLSSERCALLSGPSALRLDLSSRRLSVGCSCGPLCRQLAPGVFELLLQREHSRSKACRKARGHLCMVARVLIDVFGDICRMHACVTAHLCERARYVPARALVPQMRTQLRALEALAAVVARYHRGRAFARVLLPTTRCEGLIAVRAAQRAEVAGSSVRAHLAATAPVRTAHGLPARRPAGHRIEQSVGAVVVQAAPTGVKGRGRLASARGQRQHGDATKQATARRTLRACSCRAGAEATRRTSAVASAGMKSSVKSHRWGAASQLPSM